MTIAWSIKKEFEKARKNEWDYIYVFVDFHDTVMIPDYANEWKEPVAYDGAIELLKHLSDRKDIRLVTWTCSRKENIQKYVDFFAKDGINFDFINENPEVKETGGSYDTKPYWNILFEDKAGFNPETDIAAALQAFLEEDGL